MGAVTAIGHDVPSFWASLLAGRSGIHRVTEFDVTDYPCKIGGEVRDWDPAKHMDPKEARRNDRYTHFGFVAAGQAVKDAGLELKRENGDRVGVIIGSGIGGMHTYETQLRNLFERGPRKVSPFTIPALIGNMCSGLVAIAHGARGPNFGVVSACASGTHALGEASHAIRRGEADILVGTKLVAKSFHFPQVTLVGVVDADTMLHMPDFRSSERTMQILAQVAGRSGRAEKAGEVVLQTLQPEHIAVRGALQGDYAAFAERELALRRELGYPPFSGLVRLVWSGKDEAALAAAAAGAVLALREALCACGHEVVGPAAAVLPKAGGRFRYHALVKVADSERALDAVLARVQEWPCPKSLRLQINVDPYDLF